MSQIIQLDSAGLAKLVAQMAAQLRQDAVVREVQGQNAQQMKYFDQPGVATSYPDGLFPAVTGNQVFLFRAPQNNNIKFYQGLLVFDSASGAGRWRSDGPNPTPTVGFQVPAGGTALIIPGADNVRNFRLIAEAGATCTFASALFI